MRAIAWTTAVSLALILALGLGCGAYSRGVSREFTEGLRAAEENIQSEAWDKALSSAEGMKKAWEEKAELLSLWVNHAAVDEVTVAFSQLRVAVLQKEACHALLFAAQLREALALIDSQDAFALKNVF